MLELGDSAAEGGDAEQVTVYIEEVLDGESQAGVEAYTEGQEISVEELQQVRARGCVCVCVCVREREREREKERKRGGGERVCV